MSWRIGVAARDQGEPARVLTAGLNTPQPAGPTGRDERRGMVQLSDRARSAFGLLSRDSHAAFFAPRFVLVLACAVLAFARRAPFVLCIADTCRPRCSG